MASSSKPTMTPADSTTTFVQADPSTFRTIVQHLTGAKRPVFKLQERRQPLKKLQINSNNKSLCAGERGSLFSPVSTLDFFPILSPSSSAKRTRATIEEEEEEEGFYLHTPRRGAEPELLPLFPLHSAMENIHS